MGTSKDCKLSQVKVHCLFFCGGVVSHSGRDLLKLYYETLMHHFQLCSQKWCYIVLQCSKISKNFMVKSTEIKDISRATQWCNFQVPSWKWCHGIVECYFPNLSPPILHWTSAGGRGEWRGGECPTPIGHLSTLVSTFQPWYLKSVSK